MLSIMFCFGLLLPGLNSYGAVHCVSSISQANSAGNAGDIVYIQAGTYNQTLRPFNSGQDNQYITFRPCGGDVTITNTADGIDLTNRHHIRVDGLRIIDTTGSWVDMSTGSNHNIIENCYMRGATNAYTGINIDGGSNHNKVLNNILKSTCSCDSPCTGVGGPNDLMHIWSASSNLVEGNEFHGGLHNAIGIHDRNQGTTNWNIIRNNLFNNRLHSNFGVQGVEYILIEGNTVIDGGEDHTTNYCGTEGDRTKSREKHKGISFGTQYSIVRNNVAVNNGMGISLASGSTYGWQCISFDNRIYNNTITKNQHGIKHNSAVDPSLDNRIKNNIVYDNVRRNVSINDGNGPTSRNYFINNNIYDKGSQSDLYAENDKQINNISQPPGFVDENNRNFELQSNSAMIDAGDWLTTATNASSGTNRRQIQVADARYFMDGWDMIEGDLIQLQGQTQTARITNVDYNSKTITVNTDLNWTSGTGVSLAYNGNRPDIGAFEYGGTAIVRINSAGDAVGPYSDDKYYSAGGRGVSQNTVNTSGVTDPAPMTVYQTSRWGDNTYTIPGLTAGKQYTVRLHFAETLYGRAGVRIFDVEINGALVLDNYDIYSKAGGKNIAIVEEFTATANSSGRIVIEYIDAGPDAPKSNGIEILTTLHLNRK